MVQRIHALNHPANSLMVTNATRGHASVLTTLNPALPTLDDAGVSAAHSWSWLLAKMPSGIDAHSASFSIDFAPVGAA